MNIFYLLSSELWSNKIETNEQLLEGNAKL